MHARTRPTRSVFSSFCLSSLFAASLFGCGHQPAGPPVGTIQAQQAAPAGELLPLVEAAARGEAGATAALRAMGPPGLAALVAAYDETTERDGERWQRLSAALDAVAKQRDARAARLFWYTDLEAAKREAQATGKPILSLRLLGQLDEELSCANSRFFRTALYPNREVNKLLRDRFVLHWSSERPAPVVTIDFRDGRTLKRTVTGNSLHYVLDSQGRLVDAIPGLWGPQAFTRVVERAGELAREVAPLAERARRRRLASYHEQALTALRSAWPSALASAGIAQSPFPPDAVAPARSGAWPPPAIVALDTAPGAKAVSERPIVREFIQPPPVDLSSYVETVPWRTLAQLRMSDCRLDGSSLALMREKRPRSFSDPAALGRPLDATEFAALTRGFETAMAEDTVKNAFLYHGVLHRWLLEAMRTRGGDAFAPLNRRIYAELFRTPASDPWLGLVPPATFAALQDDGIDQ
jgi:hypothetical protein